MRNVFVYALNALNCCSHLGCNFLVFVRPCEEKFRISVGCLGIRLDRGWFVRSGLIADGWSNPPRWAAAYMQGYLATMLGNMEMPPLGWVLFS